VPLHSFLVRTADGIREVMVFGKLKKGEVFVVSPTENNVLHAVDEPTASTIRKAGRKARKKAKAKKKKAKKK